MERKIFYGEYTLRHWLDLMLKRNIVLPEYQRHFVWSKESVERFLIQLKEGLFVPPVIIGSFKKNASNDNIILDGQQRLTSVLLGYLGIYPKFDEFKEPVLSYALTFPHCLNRQPDYLWLQIKNGVRNE